MKANEVFQSDFLKAIDLADGAGDYGTRIVTISHIDTSEPFDDGNVQRVLTFKEEKKKLGLNKTNWNSCARITKQDDDDNWIGHKIELWVDPEVQYAGKTVPAIRVRKPSGAAGAAHASAQMNGKEPGPGSAPLPIVNKAAAWAAWKRQGAAGTDEDKAAFKKAADIEAANSKTPIENFGAIQWANVAEAYRAWGGVIQKDEIPF